MMMDLNWKAPFEFAFELGLFLVGSILVLAVVFISALVIYGLVKGFFTALSRARKPKEETAKPKLKTVN
jgi:hypothetical protein